MRVVTLYNRSTIKKGAMMATKKIKAPAQKYNALTVGSFEKAYGIRLQANAKSMRVSTYMSKSSAPSMGKLLKAVEKTLSK